MKITIEHEKFTATTEDVGIAKELFQMASLIDAGASMKHCAPISAEMDKYLSEHDGEPLPMTGMILMDDVPPKPKPIPTDTELKTRGKISKEYFDTLKKHYGIKETTPPPAETTDAQNALPPFNPLWTAADVDFGKNYLQQYSNPCSTLHGNCGGKCVQTELWLRNKRTGNLSVCDVEFATLDELRATLDPYVKLAAAANAAKQSQKLPCSRERLEQLAKLFNTGKSDAEIIEQCHISASSVATYRAAAKRCGLLTE